MRIVLDTNVLVSALLTPSGKSAQLLSLFVAGKVFLIMNDQIYAEYKTVLARPKFMFDQTRVQELLDFITDEAEFITSFSLEAVVLPDPKDRIFLETAVSAGINSIVTGNKKHFPREITQKIGITIYNPAQFLDYFSSKVSGL